MTRSRDYVLWLLEPGRPWERIGECSTLSIGAEVENAVAGSPPGSRVWALPPDQTPQASGEMHGTEWIVGPDGRPVHQPISTTPHVDVVAVPDGYRWRAWGHDVEGGGRTRDEAVQRWQDAAKLPPSPDGHSVT